MEQELTSTSAETEAQKIRRDLFGKSITEEEYNKAMAANLDSLPDEYIDDAHQWPSGETTHYYYKIPKVSNADLKLIIADRTRKAAEETARHTRHIKYIIIALIVAGIISGFIISHNIAEALDNLRTYLYY